MEDIISEAKAEFVRAKQRIARDLETTPDDRIDWSPSPTARTPIQIVAHAATATAGIQDMLTGKGFPFNSPVEADAAFRLAEKRFTSRQQVIDLLEETSAGYLAWLDSLTPEQIASTVDTPMRPIPMAVGITLAADHLRSHAAQIDYIQTIYGDHDWHM